MELGLGRTVQEEGSFEGHDDKRVCGVVGRVLFLWMVIGQSKKKEEYVRVEKDVGVRACY